VSRTRTRTRLASKRISRSIIESRSRCVNNTAGAGVGSEGAGGAGGGGGGGGGGNDVKNVTLADTSAAVYTTTVPTLSSSEITYRQPKPYPKP
jgi:hypothetical protein